MVGAEVLRSLSRQRRWFRARREGRRQGRGRSDVVVEVDGVVKVRGRSSMALCGHSWFL